MTDKPPRIVEFFQAIAFIVAVCAAFFIVWLILLTILGAGLFVGLSLLTNWSFLTRLLVSGVTAFLLLKGCVLLLYTLDLLPESWLRKKETEVECPYCGKKLRTPRARQCQHCHRHWLEVPDAEITQLRAERKSRLAWRIRGE